MDLQIDPVQVAVAQVKGFLYPSEAESAAAYELLVELSTRTVGAHLASTDGSIREELVSIAEMFDLTREILRRHGAETVKGSGGNLSLAVVAIRVLNEVFRPVLSRWDPILSDYEGQREDEDPKPTAIEWERRWERGSQCRTELNQMRSSIRAYIDTLSRIAGASAIADAVLNAPNSVMFEPITFTESLRPSSTPATVQPRRKMVRWLAPVEMFQTWRAGFAATASLKQLEAEIAEKPFVPDSPTVEFAAVADQDFWFDYVADMGDGFDGTAPVAWMIGRRAIDIPDDRWGDLPTPPRSMPRGQLLVFGGDEVYPFAKAGSYESQLELPYRMGLEGEPDGTEPTLVAIPGNHDWLGGIEHFRKRFVSPPGSATSPTPTDDHLFAEQWKTVQSQNWWHVKLPQGWWLWGIDTALDNELVGNQVEYFTAAASDLKAGDRVILCTPVPLWQLRQKYRQNYAALRAVFDPLIVAQDAFLPLCLSGDSHFFAHMERLDTDFGEDHITAGGGGAFLQPTHNLPERIPLEEGNAEFALSNRWPLPADSRALAPGARKVIDRQYWPLMFAVGLMAFGLMALRELPPELWSTTGTSWKEALRWTLASPWVLALLATITGLGVVSVRGNSVEPKLSSAARYYGLAIGAGVAATLAVVAATRAYLMVWLTDPDPRQFGEPTGDLWLSIGVAAAVGGVLGIAVFVGMMRWTNARIKAGDTIAFSPAYSTRFKHFVRMRIDDAGDLTCYVIGIDPVGEGWYETMTGPEEHPSKTFSVPPHDHAGIPRVHYVWGKTYHKFVPDPIDIAVSISDAAQPTEQAGSPADVQPAPALLEQFEELATKLIEGGHTLMYGGLADVGYTARLHEVDRRVHAANPNITNHVVNYVTHPRDETDPSDGRPQPNAPIPVSNPSADQLDDVARYVSDLTAMRRHMTRCADLRIVIGGALQPGDPQTRLAPGIVEEAYLAVAAGRPLIVVGGFGGAARLIADAILGGADPAEIDRLAAHFTPALPRADGVEPVDFAGMMARFNSLGVLRNGLTDGENRELLRSRDVNTVKALIVQSVRSIGSHHAH